MNNDRIEGAAKQATGTIKETAGKIIGNAKLEFGVFLRGVAREELTRAYGLHK